MRSTAARRFLLDEGNTALAAWSADVAGVVGGVLANPEADMGDAVTQFRISRVVTETSPRMGDFYRQLVIAALAQSKDRKTIAAEVAGTLRSFVSQGPGKPTESSIGWARERLRDRDEDKVKFGLNDIVRDSIEQITAVSLWADDRVRNALFAAKPPDLPATPPPTTTPLLEDPPGRLHIPRPDQEPAHSIFFNWYEHQGGRALEATAGGLVNMSAIVDSFRL